MWKDLEFMHPVKYDTYLVTLYYPRMVTVAKWYNKEQHFLDDSKKKMNVIAWDYFPKPYLFEYERLQYEEDFDS